MKSSTAVMVVFTWALFVWCAVPAFAGNGCSDTGWLIKAYNDTLYRAPSQQEISAWIDPQTLQLIGGVDRFESYFSLEVSPEGQVDYLGGNLQVYAALAASDEYCNGVFQVQPGELRPIPQFQIVQNLNQNVAGPPPVYSLSPPSPPNQVSANGLVLNLQNRVVAQDVTIADRKSVV